MNHTTKTQDPNIEYLLNASQGTSRDELLRMANSLSLPKTSEIKDPTSLVAYLTSEGFSETLIQTY